MLGLASLSATAASMHTVFSTECTSYFDWQSVGLFYSHQEVLQPGYITRLMACDHPDGYAGAGIGPTHVHPNYGNPKNNHVHDRYTPYNKPGALQHWLDNTYTGTEPPPEYVLLVDPDTIFRKPIDCHRELGVRPGVAASSPRPYLEGVDNGMAAQFVSPEAVGRIDKVGGFLCLHIDDLRKVVPLWINFTVQMRKNPQRYWQIDGVGVDFPTGVCPASRALPCDPSERCACDEPTPGSICASGDDYVVRGHAPYISDMYGYVFAAAEVGIRHSIREDVLLTPGNPPVYEPTLLHYDKWCKFGERNFNKLSYKSGFSIQNCRQYFPRPPDLELLLGQDIAELGTELMCIEQVTVLNEALCEYHKRSCCKYETVSFGCHKMRPWKHGAMTAAGCEKSCCDRGGVCSHFVFDESDAEGPCFHSRFRRGECAEGEYPLASGSAVARVKQIYEIECPTPAWSDVQRMQDEQNVLGGTPTCQDTEPACADWEAKGECSSNAGYMRLVCPKTCRVEGCWDRHSNCPRWAEIGQCEENFQYMIETCPVVCRERRSRLAEERASKDAGRLQQLRDARAEQDAGLALDTSLAEEAVDPETEHAATVAENVELFQPARAVASARGVYAAATGAPNATGKGHIDVPLEDELEIAWMRVMLAGACGLLCAATVCRRLHGCRKRHAVHVISKHV